MDITEYADALNLELAVRRYPNRTPRWTASFAYAETKDSKADATLTGLYGSGRTPTEAIRDYADQLQGKVLIVRAGHPDERREYQVPAIMEYT